MNINIIIGLFKFYFLISKKIHKHIQIKFIDNSKDN